jgi:hypothetical protein
VAVGLAVIWYADTQGERFERFCEVDQGGEVEP